MSKKRIHIDSLSIRLPQRARGSERSIAENIGREILTGIAEATRNRTGARKVEALTTNISTKDLRGVSGQVSRSMADEIAKQFEQGGRK
ncbi:MAG: hypothetical protein WBD16_11095 [Pyrinomonadaceae bacterium]